MTSKHPLDRLLPPQGMLQDGELLSLFLEYVKEKNLVLYPAQEDAILALYEGKNVILRTPTGSGKSLVAAALHFYSLASGRRSFYTCPIKALVNEKFLALCKDFGPERVGMITGDGSVNAGAPIICCTAEILSNLALREGELTPVDDVVMDEFHYFSDRDRGVAWQVPLLTLPKTRFLLMSATLGETSIFEERLTALNGKETVLVHSSDRPVPLEFTYQEVPLHETIQDLIRVGKAPVYLVSFSQRECAEEAQNLLSVDFNTKEEKRAIAEALGSTKFISPNGKEIQKLLRHGIGIHHAGLLPKYRLLVEKLAQTGLLKVICGTDTLGVGVNIPIRTVLLSKLCKFDGEKTAILTVRDFHQIAGRAGRKGFDDRGFVVAQAPEHIIENLVAERKAQNDAKKLKKLVKKKPPEKGYVPWGKDTFDRLINSTPEPLTSRFQVTHGMLLNVLSRADGRGCEAMKSLVRSSFETPVSKQRHRSVAFQMFRSLLDRNILTFIREEGAKRAKIQVHVDLQEDFSLHHTLSLYLLDTLKLLDPYDLAYPLNVLTLVESILENPELILRRQLDRLKGAKLQELKLAGIEYEERMEELEKLEYPKPLREFIYDSFNEFSKTHPWASQENIRPKSVAREMYELFFSFFDYVRDYDLQPTEGLLLRYLSEVYKVLVQSVPPQVKSPEVEEIIVYFGAMIRQVDSSLIDEWERMRGGVVPSESSASLESQGDDITRDERGFLVLVRNEAFRLIRMLAKRDLDGILMAVEPEREEGAPHWTRQDLEAIAVAYQTDHGAILTSPEARSKDFMSLKKDQVQKIWTFQQTIVDREAKNDWIIDLEIPLSKSKEAGKPVLRLKGIHAIS